MRFRKLRVAWSMAWGVTAVLLGLLCVRSYWWMDVVERTSSTSSVEFRSNGGSTYIFYDRRTPTLPPPPARNAKWEFKSFLAAPIWQPILEAQSSIQFPGWLTVLVAGLVAAVPWIRWSTRFSLRALLVVTTLVAIGLATIVVRWR